MGGGHDHGLSAAAQHRGRLALVLGLTLVVLVAEVIGAIVTGSLALLADAGHVATDAAGIGLALLAAWFGARPPTPQRTYGYYRYEILAAVANAVLLIGVAGFVLVEAVRRFDDPPDVAGGPMLVFALVGLIANGIGLALLARASRTSLNVRGAYLEVLGDLLGSVAVVAAAVVITLTGASVVDPIASVLVGVMILPRVWSLLKDAVDVLLEATPKHVDPAAVRDHIVAVPGVVDVHDLHIWTITSGMPVMSAHVVVDAENLRDGGGQVLDALCDCLADHFDVAHSTFQLEEVGHVGHESTALH